MIVCELKIQPYKDHMYFNHVSSKCSEMKYVFKGDDDVLILPVNFLKMLEQLDSLEGKSMIGCLKEYDFPVPDISSRYFVPEYFRTEQIFPPYYSGAGYVMTQEAMKKVRFYCQIKS